MAYALKTLLHSVLKTEGSWKMELLIRWPEIIGDLGSKVILEKIQDTTLVLSVANASWMQELYLLSPLLLRTINEKLDQPRIKHLRFKQAELKKVRPQAVAPDHKPLPRELHLSPHERAALGHVKDPELSAALTRFLARCHQNKEL